jgi:propanol-preferring alcohol dehydrogenase
VKPKLPFIPGHEGVGHVAALGAGVTNLKEGDLVGVPWLHSACGACEFCLTGWETLCPQQQNTGSSVNGGFADYVLAPASYVGRIPKGLKPIDVAPIQYARAMGLHLTAVDVGDDKLALAKQLGAELTVNAAAQDPAAVIQKQVGGAHGVQVKAVSPKVFRQSIDMLRRGGTCALVGLPPGDFPTPIFDVVLKGLTVRGAIVGTRKDLEESLQFAAEGKVKAAVETQPLEAINDVFSALEGRRGQRTRGAESGSGVTRGGQRAGSKSPFKEKKKTL